jgi:hypothetical protein
VLVCCSSSATRAKVLAGPCKDHYIYNTVIRAIIESSLIVWMGLLTYAITETWMLSQLESYNTSYNTYENVSCSFNSMSTVRLAK